MPTTDERLAALEADNATLNAKVNALEAIAWRQRLLIGQVYYASAHAQHAQEEVDAIVVYQNMGDDASIALVQRVYQLDVL